MLIDLCLCFFFFKKRLGWIGRPRNTPKSVWTGPAETRRVRFGAKKKTRLLNGLGPSNKGGPAGRVRVSKNPVQTQPIAIPIVTKQNIYYLEQNIYFGSVYVWLGGWLKCMFG